MTDRLGLEHPEVKLVLTVVVAVAVALLGKYLWDRMSAPERLGQESRRADATLRDWVERLFTEQRTWLEVQFNTLHSRMREQDTSIASLESRITVVERICEINHGQIRRSDPPGFDPTDLRCNEGERRS